MGCCESCMPSNRGYQEIPRDDTREQSKATSQQNPVNIPMSAVSSTNPMDGRAGGNGAYGNGANTVSPYQQEGKGTTPNAVKPVATNTKTTPSRTPVVPPTPATLADQFDMNTSPFEGLELQQKFTNKSSYDTRFMWLNLHSLTIHMSQYMSKERRHKEASLKDIQNVIAGLPAKSKSSSSSGQTAEPALSPNCCLTINFRRGGGIDLMFKNEQDRNVWVNALNKILVHVNNENNSKSNADGNHLTQ